VTRVHLEKAATGAIIPQLVIGKPKENVELQRLEAGDAQKEESETYEFQWQEKVFSQVQIQTLPVHCSYCILLFPLQGDNVVV